MAKVLVVDDAPAILRAVTRTLRGAGYDVLTAEDGLAAFEIVAHQSVDLLITDVLMPGMSGIELITRIKSIRSELPIIAMSGSETAWAAAQLFGSTVGDGEAPSPLSGARRAGVDATIAKPFDAAELIEVVKRTLSPTSEAGPPGTAVTFHVRPDRGRWRVHRTGTSQSVARAADLDAALFLARRLAAGYQRARVIVHNPDDTIRALYTYGDGGA